MTARAQAQCTPTCALYRSMFTAEGQARGMERPFCQPFPDGIPDVIWTNQFDHRNVYPGQVGEAVWTPAAEGVTFPTYALAVTEDAAPPTITAAADGAITGAMIALVPSQADLDRLAIPRGEAPEDLHLTLVYLGEAVDVLPAVREELIAWAQDMALGWDGVQGDGFAPAWFNPTGEEPCLVLVCSGPDLAEMHETVLADISDSLDLPDQHLPFIPHVTLYYMDPAQVPEMRAGKDRSGPITFDRIRLAFGGDVTDVPLGSKGEPAPAEASPAAETQAVPAVAAVAEAPNVATAGPIREVWDGPLR